MLSEYWRTFQRDLFPWLEEDLGPLGVHHRRFVTVIETVRLEAFVGHWSGLPGRPLKDRAALARAFVAKAVFKLATTEMLIERVHSDKILRRLCGWSRPTEVPSPSTFSRAFAAFAASDLPGRVHAALIERAFENRLVGHISRDSTAIEVREKPVKPTVPAAPKRKRGRPRKGEERPKEPRRLERQGNMTQDEMLADLPRHCAVGTKRNAKGHQTSWIGYKLHLDVADGDIPVTGLLTSASLHDSQAAIPLASLTAGRVTNLYDLMDSAYDAPEIASYSRALGHVPIIDVNPRTTERKKDIANEAKARRRAGHRSAEDIRYNERSAGERVNGRLKDDFGADMVRVRGHDKVMCHLMFGVLALTVEQLFRLVT
jgi:hypothetical protein